MRVFDSIVVGVDGSDAAAAAIRWAVQRARETGSRLRLVHAYTEPLVSPGVMALGAAMPGDPTNQDARAAEAILAAAVETVRADAVEVSAAAVLGSAAAVLLVVGSRDPGTVAGVLAGSVGVEVSAHARCPTAVIRGEAYRGGPVVVGVDGSDGARAALGFALAEATRRKVPVMVVSAGVDRQALDVNPADLPAAGCHVDGRQSRESRPDVDDPFASWRAAFPDVELHERVVDADASTALIEASGTAAMVVVGSRGRGDLIGALLGSTSRHLLRHATCPVVVIGPAAHDASASWMGRTCVVRGVAQPSVDRSSVTRRGSAGPGRS